MTAPQMDPRQTNPRQAGPRRTSPPRAALPHLVRAFRRDEAGATAIEYGLLAMLISVVIIAGAQLLGSEVKVMFDDLGDCVSNPTTTSGAVSAACKSKTG